MLERDKLEALYREARLALISNLEEFEHYDECRNKGLKTPIAAVYCQCLERYFFEIGFLAGADMAQSKKR